MDTSRIDHLPRGPSEHFKLRLYAAVEHLLERLTDAFGSTAAAIEHFPFLAGYRDELQFAMENNCALEQWREVLARWEASAPGHLPLRALRESAALSHPALTLLITIGLIEEDSRFGLLFETMQGSPGQRPTAGLLSTLWRASTAGGDARDHLRTLCDLGLVQIVNPEASRPQWILQCPAPVWDAIRGDRLARPAPWLDFREPSELPRLDALILPRALEQTLAALPPLLSTGEIQGVVVRGSRRNGRRTLLSALARRIGRGILAPNGIAKLDDERWKLLGPLSVLLQAMPVVAFELGANEVQRVPSLEGYSGPTGIVLGKQGGIEGLLAERTLTLTLEIPDADARRRHWVASLGAERMSDLVQICERFRMTGGNIRRAASLAASWAAVEGRASITMADALEASRALNRQTLDTLASRVDVSGNWSHLAAPSHTFTELRNLEGRCRHRERLQLSLGPQKKVTPGVRALFAGPSGTGKTLAACLLASVLEMDLYRVDLSSVVNKYIGETEKNLNRLFSHAEELDVILLLDEGDALLTQRTSVNNSNDRYANLETNYLLQRIEAYEGILIVTSNAAERIDSAFQRRMDVVVDFRPPDAPERWIIWQAHLPSFDLAHPELLQEIAARCVLSGGQIRNAAVHASLLALDAGRMVSAAHVEEAVRREYSKLGAVCPLPRTAAAIRAV
jgi:hypothetical protein